MYQYDEYDQQILNERVAQFKSQTERYLAGEIAEDEFLPLRLQNGIYVQRYAPMLRVAIPYGAFTAEQMRALAKVARDYDKGYAHFSTRQNLQFNWPKLEDCPQILADLAKVQMHAVQTSGNCIRNTTTDEYAGVVAEELVDPRPYCEIIRQWSTFHPEFAFLPRKFKIAVNSVPGEDRAATKVHDIGVHIIRNDAGELGYRILVGGGLGRTPIIGETIREFLPEQDLLTYLEAVIRVYNQFGRRDNKYKARIKILTKALGVQRLGELVEAEWNRIKDSAARLTSAELERVKKHFVDPAYATLDNNPAELETAKAENPAFVRWLGRNVRAHKQSGYAVVTLTLKQKGTPPGDVTAEQMEQIATLADEFSFGELRSTHQQNLVLANVEQRQLFTLWQQAKALGLATPTLGLLTDMICCPGGDFCALANAKSIPIADDLQVRFDDLDYLHDLGEIDLNISGCMNACGHHHVGNIGILGVDKKGQEFYQVSLGGNSGERGTASLGKILGPSFSREQLTGVVAKVLDLYVASRHVGESFLETYQRIGHNTFKEAVYGKAD
ncbi:MULTISPECIES: nitrite/sulfite reductase [unclassified Oceanobacter]|uniref:nitrite/sulfite reductase n=1 Tax=unclassified Oceanobacter TaxID=2620260 RepID=UPI0026E24524|nr:MULTISPECIES: nitrite/sulfite reductase [unclassified Oceanobacter]MDO6681114.1 nitrite/sulfite reductase [Oceanobacter sp. 5_MG-2023]MDP2504314.1 nitrite/sulfite reductase [Oceanobacter sp. 3_MG-2023]MDP2608508.1 nitrite/sulfite reductase [Oceanobacter sp. 1_MG-2023]MDP2611730.1 nitrite/sulfite reductase [Oceanobacter sp. 2_MG-2023]